MYNYNDFFIFLEMPKPKTSSTSGRRGETVQRGRQETRGMGMRRQDQNPTQNIQETVGVTPFRRSTRLSRQTGASAGMMQISEDSSGSAVVLSVPQLTSAHRSMLRSRTLALLSSPFLIPGRRGQTTRGKPAGGRGQIRREEPAGGRGRITRGDPTGVGTRPAGRRGQITRGEAPGVGIRPAAGHRRITRREPAEAVGTTTLHPTTLGEGPISPYAPMGSCAPTEEETVRDEVELKIYNYDDDDSDNESP